MADAYNNSGGYEQPSETTLRVEISDIGKVLFLNLSFELWCKIKQVKEADYNDSDVSAQYDSDTEYSFGELTVLPKGRQANLRDRISSVNSEVTIHDVRRCTITGTSSKDLLVY